MHFRKRWESRFFIFFKKKYFYPRISRDLRGELSLRKENSKGDGKQRETFVISMLLLAWHFSESELSAFQILDTTGKSILLPIYSFICIREYSKKPLSRTSKKIIWPYVSFFSYFPNYPTNDVIKIRFRSCFVSNVNSIKAMFDNANSSCFIIKLFYLN